MVLVRQTEPDDLKKGEVAVGIQTVEALVAGLVTNAKVLQNAL